MRFVALLAAAAALLVSPAARADGFSPDESSRLMRGEAVSRPQQAASASGRRLVGGVTYEIIDATAPDIAALVADERSWRGFLPRTREVRHVGNVKGDTLVELTHGTSLLSVSYTLRMHKDANITRFWMDRSRPHDIEDVWGYVRAMPMHDGRTLLTWGILIDMGPGLLRDLFEDKVQKFALQVPDRVRDAMFERAARGQRASQ